MKVQKLNEDRINSIYMIRQDNTVYDLSGLNIHPLLNPNWDKDTLINIMYDVIDNLCWYYNNLRSTETKRDIYELATMLLYYNESAIHKFERSGLDINREDIYKEEPFDMEGLYKHIALQCAQEFIKVRFGGNFNTRFNNIKDIYFRVASTGFNWFNMIWEFVVKHEKEIDYVTIVRDKELTGEETVYEINNVDIDRMPVKEFINIKGNPIIESEDEYIKKLSLGKTLSEAYGVHNHRHVIQQLKSYRYKDKLNWLVK